MIDHHKYLFFIIF